MQYNRTRAHTPKGELRSEKKKKKNEAVGKKIGEEIKGSLLTVEVLQIQVETTRAPVLLFCSSRGRGLVKQKGYRRGR